MCPKDPRASTAPTWNKHDRCFPYQLTSKTTGNHPKKWPMCVDSARLETQHDCGFPYQPSAWPLKRGAAIQKNGPHYRQQWRRCNETLLIHSQTRRPQAGPAFPLSWTLLWVILKEPISSGLPREKNHRCVIPNYHIPHDLSSIQYSRQWRILILGVNFVVLSWYRRHSNVSLF